MGFVLVGKSAEYLHFVNKQEPNLQFYDLLIRMEDLLNENDSQGVMSPVKMHHRQNLTQTQTQYSTPVPVYPGNNCPFPASNIVQGPQLNSHCSQTKRHTAYEGPQYVYGTNSTIENQSIHTDIVSCSYHGRILNEEHESDMGTACESNPRQQRYVPYRGPNKIKSFEKVLASNEDSAMKQEDQTACTLSRRMARLEEMFSRITDLTDSNLLKQCKSEKQASTLHNHKTLPLHNPHSSSLHDPHTPSLQDLIPTEKDEKSISTEYENMKLQQSSETRSFRNSMEDEQRIQSLEEYANGLDGICNQPFVTSTPKEPSRVKPVYEDLSDQDFEENDSGESSLLQLFSKKGQIGLNTPSSQVPVEMQVTSRGESACHQEIQVLSSLCTEIQESNSGAAEFWWDSLETKQLGVGEEKDSLGSCEEFIDFMHYSLFGTSNLNSDTPSTSEEYEAWVDKKFADTFCSEFLQKICHRDESVREVELMSEKSESKSPAQQEQNYSICFAEPLAASLHGVTPISAWNPSLDSEKNLSLNVKGNPAQDSKEEYCSDCSFGTVTICQQQASSSALRIPVTVQGVPLKAVVDTAAMVSIVFYKVCREWTVNVPHLRAVALKTAVRDLKMDGHIVGPVSLEVGSSAFSVMVHIAPIYEDMLLGLNFLLEHAVDISLREFYLLIRQDNEKVPLEIVNSDRAGHTVSNVTVGKVEEIPANPISYGKSYKSLNRANCILHQPERLRQMSTILLWHKLGFSMPFPQTGSFGPSMSINFHQLESASPNQSKSRQALLEAIPGRPHVFKIQYLSSELNHLSPCRLEVVIDASSLKYVHTVSTHNCHYLRSLVQLRASVLCLREDGQQWQWDPGGEDFDRLIKGDLLTVRNKTSGHVTNL